jgi:hypothetical protein
LKRVIGAIQRFNDDERGHLEAGGPSLLGAIGAIMLGIGAAGDTDWVPIAGGVILGIAIMAAGVARHRGIDYGIYARLETLEKK